ncbi:MAG: hypothetical protein BJ554DRAFT_7520 [Olpidium bornovanus]|uniref:Interleukin-6 n=1 Tax=Olpidium bornovanus TaxID=278681 RepID=A0A8H8DJD4_9FUNG|nr:MAG: hypothetical protein BJ554DRAFT_7520 [Olpidium bornovanus]
MKFSTALLALAAVPAALVAAVLPGEGSVDAPAASAYAELLKSHVRAHIEMVHDVLKCVAGELSGELSVKPGPFGPPCSPERGCFLKWFRETMCRVVSGLPKRDRVPTEDSVISSWLGRVADSLRKRLNDKLDQTPTRISQMQEWPAKIVILNNLISRLRLSPKNNPFEVYSLQLRSLIRNAERDEDLYARYIDGNVPRKDQDDIQLLISVLKVLHENREKALADILEG